MSRISFAASLAVLAFLYGFSSSAYGWFPNDVLVGAWHQATALFEPEVPHFLRPRVYEFHGVRAASPDRMQPGYTFVVSSQRIDGGWTPQLKLIDQRGRTIHEWHIDDRALLIDVEPSHPAYGKRLDEREIHGARVLANGDVVFNYDYLGTFRIDACGTVLWHRPYISHHSVAEAEDGSFWVSAHFDQDHQREFDGIGRPGGQDRILRLDPAGDILREIDVLGVLLANDLAYKVARSGELRRGQDLLHLNDVEPLGDTLADEYPMFDAGDLLLSLRDLHLVLVLDPESLRVKWYYEERLHAQHDPDFLGDGWIGVFNNRPDGTRRGTMLGGTQIIAVQPATDSVRVLFPTPASDPFYTQFMGKWQALPNGNLLLTEAEPGRVVEVGPGGETIWEWVQRSTEIGGEWWVPHVTAGLRCDLDPEQIRTWPCSGLE